MNISASKLNINQLDKSDWKTYCFEDIAEKRSTTVNPQEANVDIYVGLEHIDSDDIHIRRKGKPSDVKGGKLRCSPGDVIFGKRRAYQRKAAIVDFEGICSAHAFVLRAKSEILIPELFPFFLHSNQFMHRMIDISVGGLSPTINWGDMKKQEFMIPPKTIQDDLLKMLTAVNKVIQKNDLVLKKLLICDLSLLKHHFYDDRDSRRIKFKNVASVKKGKKPEILLKKGDGLPYCTAKYLRNGELEHIVPEVVWSKAIRITKQDILILWDGSNAGEMLFGQEGFLASTMCVFELFNQDFTQDFVFQFLRFKTHDIKRATVGSAIPHVDPGMIDNIEIPKLKINQQNLISDAFEKLRVVKDLAKLKAEDSRYLQKKLINQVF